MHTGSLVVFAGALAIMAATPGPSIAALVARVLSHGWRGTLPFLAALWIGEAAWLAAAVLGLGIIAQEFYWALLVWKITGVAYLLYLAWTMWTAPANIDAAATKPRQSALRLFLAGLALTLGNPKLMVFYLLLLPTLLDVSKITPLALSELIATMFLVFIVTDGFYLVLASRARRMLCSPRAVRMVNRIGAGAMAGAAVVIGVDAA